MRLESAAAAALALLTFSSAYKQQDGLTTSSQSYSSSTTRSIKIEGDQFVLDGKPFRYVSGSLHYFRLPREYWRDRLRKLRAAGLNAVSTYVEWSFHEPEERQYRWDDDRDLVHFLELAAEEQLLVLLRPGPYICAERDLGGLPYWLLSKYPDINLRSTDQNFMTEAKIWLDVLFAKINHMMYGNGGPIILVQVENEYGSYACDGPYKLQLRDLMRPHVADAALLYTTDGYLPNMIKCGSINDTLTTIDFGSGTNVSLAFSTLRQFQPQGPEVNSEFYPGWLTHWGEKSMSTVGSKAVVKTLQEMLQKGASVNFYVFFGGTNFEFTAGANYGPLYQPDVTSYDYDAPITESGELTSKYDAIKKILEEYHPWAKELKPPAAVATSSYGDVALTPRVALLSDSGRSLLGVHGSSLVGASLPTFESRRQRGGLMLFETTVPPGDASRLLHIAEPRDRVYVYVDDKYAGVISRMHGILSLPVEVKNNSKLSLLVENQGRINYGSRLKDFKGILSEVLLDTKVLSGNWSVLGYPLERINLSKDTHCESEKGILQKGPIIYEGSFTLPEGASPQDTFLNPRGWSKGYAWVNGHNLGRYWPSVGPQITLYVPGVYLLPAPASNTLRLLELEAAPTDFRARLTDQHELGRRLNIAVTGV